jgi:hypothetical protein
MTCIKNKNRIYSMGNVEEKAFQTLTGPVSKEQTAVNHGDGR